MTERLYYQDANLREFTARIVAHRETAYGPAVRLDKTAFYPTSGGQPHDTGTINDIPVIDVWEEADGAVWHRLERPPESDEVKGAIDWERRFEHMQQHTGQHILSAAFIQSLEAHTTGFHMGSQASTIDLEIVSLTWEQTFQVEEEANRVVWENRPVRVLVVSEGELGEFPLRKPPQVSGKIRVIWVEGYDASACGGTHVSRTGQVGLLKITALERYKGGMRVSFLCGGRALQDYRRSLRELQQASAVLSVHQDELGEAVARLQEEAKEARRALKKAQAELLELEAKRLWEEAQTVGGVRRIVAHWTERSFTGARTIASRLQERPRTLLLFAVTEAEGVRIICARSQDLVELDAAAILGAVTEALGGRGGGSATIAQGGAPLHPPETVLEVMKHALQL